MLRNLPLDLLLSLCLLSPRRASALRNEYPLRRVGRLTRALEDLLPINGGTSSVLTSQAEGALVRSIFKFDRHASNELNLRLSLIVYDADHPWRRRLRR